MPAPHAAAGSRPPTLSCWRGRVPGACRCRREATRRDVSPRQLERVLGQHSISTACRRCGTEKSSACSIATSRRSSWTRPLSPPRCTPSPSRRCGADDLVRLRREDVPCLRGRRVLLGEAEDVPIRSDMRRDSPAGEPTGSKVTETRRLDLLGVVPPLHLGREDRSATASRRGCARLRTGGTPWGTARW